MCHKGILEIFVAIITFLLDLCYKRALLIRQILSALAQLQAGLTGLKLV